LTSYFSPVIIRTCFLQLRRKKMKNKLLKSSAFVLALSSSLWNQSEAMMHMTADYEKLSKDIDAVMKDALEMGRNSLRISAEEAVEAGEPRERILNIMAWTLQDDLTLQARDCDYASLMATQLTFIVNPSGTSFADGPDWIFSCWPGHADAVYAARARIVDEAVAGAFGEVTRIVSENKKALEKKLLSLCLAAQLAKRLLTRSLVSSLVLSGYALEGKGLAGVPRDEVSGVLWTQWCLNKGC
jgi:hypothetical protein